MTNQMWSVHRYEETDESELLGLLAVEYGGSDITKLDFFRWQYEHNPAGRALIWVARGRQSGEVVGQYWILPMRVQILDQVQMGGVIVNVVVHPSYRRQGMGTALAKSAHADCPHRGLDFHYGIPSPSSYHMDTVVMKNRELGRLPLLIRPLDWGALAAYRFDQAWLKHLARAGQRIVTGMSKGGERAQDHTRSALRIDEVARFGDTFDAFWARVEQKYPVALVRDAAWLNWRYKDVPTRAYRALAAYEGQRLVGYAVTRCTTFEGVRTGLIVDLMVEPTQAGDQAARALVAEATASFVEEGMHLAGCLMLPTSQEFRALRRQGYWVCPRRLEPQPFPLTTRLYSDGVPSAVVQDLRCWHFTMGDYDVV
jgi:ribosomal protein S18 acetylase RimI-like enzyme